MELIKRRHSVTSLQAHLVFTTTYGRKILTGKHIEQLRWAFSMASQKLGCEVQEMDGEQDHVHLLIAYPPKLSISLIVNNLKATASRRLRELNPELKMISKNGALWSRAYFACSVGGAPIEVLKQYIEQQETPK